MTWRVLFLSLAGFASLCACTGSQNIDQLDQEIRQQLPVGATRHTVIQFLRSRNVPSKDSNDIPYYKGPRKVWGTLPDRNKYTLIKSDVVLTFEFDQDDRLVSYKMGKQSVGP